MSDNLSVEILSLSASEARDFLLRSSSYCEFDLPSYFSFRKALKIAGTVPNPGTMSKRQQGKRHDAVRALYDVNHTILANKSGPYGWRPFQLVHPVLYVRLVNALTEKSAWAHVQSRFAQFCSDKRLRCLSIPRVPKTGTATRASVMNWWKHVEQESVRLSLDYAYMATADVADCYGSIYTHSVAWALHSKATAKKNRKDKTLIGNQVDDLLQDIQNGQTNGIPQGNAVSDLIAEMVLGYADLELSAQLSKKDLKEFQILRYRDDYRIFTHSREDAQLILLELTNTLADLGLKLNENKTRIGEDVLGRSIKPDKLYWNGQAQSRRSLFKTLLLIDGLARNFPNSGALVKPMQDFRKRLENRSSQRTQADVLIATTVDIMFRNPRLYPQGASIISKLLESFDDNAATQQIGRIKKRFSLVPNIGMLEVWLQRITYPIDPKYGFEEPLCAAVAGGGKPLWNSSWLDPTEKKKLDQVTVVKKKKLAKLPRAISLQETDAFFSAYDQVTTEP